MADPKSNKITTKEIAFNGRLRTYEDPASIAPSDFVTLENLRYAYTHPKSIYGMTVVTPTGAPQNIGSMVHFRKGQPEESHVLVHAVSAIYDMNSAISASGAFGSALWTDTAAGATARFAYTNGLLAYANGVGDTCVYGGDDFRTGGFIVYTSASKYDHTDAVNNVLDTAGNVATLKTYISSADSNTKLLLHMDGNGNDSGAGGHNFNGPSITYPTYWGGFSSAAYFNGSAYLSATDHADFNLSGTSWTIDFKLRDNSPTDNTARYIYWQQSATSADRMEIYVQDTTSHGLNYRDIYFKVVSGGSDVVSLKANGTYEHFAIARDTSTSPATYRFFQDGNMVYSTAVSSEPGNYTSNVYIGSNSTPGNYFTGYIDEFRISNVARWTSGFSVPTTPYSTNNYTSNIYLGSIMPLSGAKFTIADSKSGKSVNFAVNEWNGSNWNAVTPSPSSATFADDTATTVTWANTSGTSKMREVEKVVSYWYQVVLSSAVDFDGVTISRATTKVPFQPIRDFWSGEPFALAAFLVNKSSSFNDYTANISNDTYDSANDGSYAKLVSLTNSDYVVVGATNRLMGFVLQFAGDKINSTNTTINVSYYNGTDSPDQSGAWTNVSGLVDGTLNGTNTFNKSGFVTWTPPSEGSEFKSAGWSSTTTQKTGIFQTKTTIKSTSNPIMYPLYYYKITFTGATTSADIRIPYAYGIPAQRTIRGFNFAVVHQDRLWLCGDTQKDKNYVICSGYQSPTVLGYGRDNAEFWLGDDTEIVAGASLYTRVGTTTADTLVLCKQSETYIITGDNPDTYIQRRVSEHIGCIAPLSMVTVPMGDDAIPGMPRNIAIWVSQMGVVAFDGSNFHVISQDIYDRFESTNANYIGAALATATAYYDSTYGEYHLVIPGSSEYVYDVRLKRWYTVDRGSYSLRCGASVYDSNGFGYTYGAAGTKLYRLENGTTMAGEAYTRTLRTGDMALPEGSIQDFSRVNWYALVGKAMTNSVTGTYFTDTSTTAGTSAAMVTTNSGKRLFNRVAHSKDTQATFHGFQFEVADMFEPLYLVFRYTIYPRELS